MDAWRRGGGVGHGGRPVRRGRPVPSPARSREGGRRGEGGRGVGAQGGEVRPPGPGGGAAARAREREREREREGPRFSPPGHHHPFLLLLLLGHVGPRLPRRDQLPPVARSPPSPPVDRQAVPPVRRSGHHHVGWESVPLPLHDARGVVLHGSRGHGGPDRRAGHLRRALSPQPEPVPGGPGLRSGGPRGAPEARDRRGAPR